MKIVIGKGSCGIAAGANRVSDAAKEYIDIHQLQAHICETGCIGMCFLEPIVDVINEKGDKTTSRTMVGILT